MAATLIDDSGGQVRWLIRQGDAWPKDPLELVVANDDAGADPVLGLIESARITVRSSFRAADELGAASSLDVGSGVTISSDGSTVQVAAGTFPTDAYPLTDETVTVAQQSPCRADVEVTHASNGKVETILTVDLVVRPQVSR